MNPSRDLSSDNSKQDVDSSDTVLLGNVYAGTDNGLTDETLSGVQLTSSIMDDVEDVGHYATHPMHVEDPGFTNHTTFSGPGQFFALFTVKYPFGD